MKVGTVDYDWGFDESPNMFHIQMRIRFLYLGFLTADKFLEDWFRLSAQGRIGTTLDFRKRFCTAPHFQVQLPSKKWAPLAELWGHPMPYVTESGKLKLLRILPKGWHLKQVGRSIRPPALCSRKP